MDDTFEYYSTLSNDSSKVNCYWLFVGGQSTLLQIARSSLNPFSTLN